MITDQIKKSIRNIPDFPKPGIQFKDITTLLQNKSIFEQTINEFYNAFQKNKIDTVIGIESRGFIFAAPLALKLGASFVMVRKAGKLPHDTLKKEYTLEYGTDILEIHKDSVNSGDRVLIVDDLLATGGSAKAAGELVEELKGKIVSYVFLIELSVLDGKSSLTNAPVYSLIEF